MSNHEAPVDTMLDAILMREKMRVHFLRSTHLRVLKDFYAGDRVSMELKAIDFDGVQVETDKRVEGILVDPDRALVDIKYIEGDMDEWADRTIGLATWHEVRYPNKCVKHLDAHYVAGNQEVAYFLPEHMTHRVHRELTVRRDDIRSLALKYGKLAVDGAVIFDFINPRPQ